MWRRYGYTIVRELARAGTPQAGAAAFLDTPELRTRQEVRAEIRAVNSPGAIDGPEVPLDEAWASWLTRANTLFTDGAALADRTEGLETTLDGHASIAASLYQRITERKIDAELRDLFDAEAAMARPPS